MRINIANPKTLDNQMVVIWFFALFSEPNHFKIQETFVEVNH